MRISNKGFVLVLLIALTDIAACDGNELGKCRIKRHTKDQISEYYADCSDLDLTDIPDNLPPNTTCLNMIGNKISQINGKPWQSYALLKKLSLARNRIDRVRSGDFVGLSMLEMLDLSLNQIRYINIRDDSFQPLTALTFLDIKQNLPNSWINEEYPAALKGLQHLRTLVIDGLGTQSLPYMPNLVELYMSGEYGRCNIPNINGSFFDNVSGVQNLFMSNCSIKKIENESFKSLPNITSLDLSWNINLGIESLPNITSGLNGSKTLKRLNLNTLYDHSQFDFCSSAIIDDIKYLSNSSIELFTIENNNLVRMDIATVIQWPKSIKYLSVQHNMFLYGNYTPYMIYTGMLNNIVYLDISRMSASNRPVYTTGYAVSMDKELERLQSKTQASFQPEITRGNFHSLCMSMFTRYQVQDYFQVIKDKLKQHDIGIVHEVSDRLETHSSSSKLEYLDLSENLPVLIERMFEIFPKIPNLKVLNISRNYLGYPLYEGTSIIGFLKNIRTLDLSDNKIINLLPNIFNNLTKLETLHLSHNKISNITFELSHMKNLSYLDLEDNSLENINFAARDEIDQLLNIRINIAHNNLKCTCENTDFLLWVKRNINKIAKIQETNCTFKNSTSVSLATLNYNQLRSECTSYLTLILSVTIIVLFSIVIIISALVYKFRWDLRYLYNVTKMKIFTGYRRINKVDYKKDVFVLYDDNDREFVLHQVQSELETKGQISLLTQEDFEPDHIELESVMQAIKSTRRTLVILTSNFVKSGMCTYGMNTALQAGVDLKRRTICVILKDIPLNDLPEEIQDVLRLNTYLEFPTKEDDLQGFWDKLRTTLTHDS